MYIKIIVLVVASILLVLQLNKMRKQASFNRKLMLKQKQLRTYENFKTLKNYKAPKYGLVFNFVVVVALVFVITNPVDSKNDVFSAKSVDYTANSVERSALASDGLMFSSEESTMNSDFSTFGYSALVDSSLLVDSNYIYHLNDNVLNIYEIVDGVEVLLESIEINDFSLTTMYQTDDFISIVGQVEKEDILNDSEYNKYETVIESYSKKDFSKISTYYFDGSLVNVTLEDSDFVLTTKNYLYDGISAENAKPYYVSNDDVNIINDEEIIAIENVEQEYIYNVFKIDIEKDKVSMNSYAISGSSFVIENKDASYLFTTDVNGNSVLLKQDLSLMYYLNGTVYSEANIHFYEDDIYMIVTTTNDYKIVKLDSSFNLIGEYYLGTYPYNVKFSSNLLTYSQVINDELVNILFNLKEFKVKTTNDYNLISNDSYLNSNILLYEKDKAFSVKIYDEFTEELVDYSILKKEHDDYYFLNKIFDKKTGTLILIFGNDFKEMNNLTVCVQLAHNSISDVTFIETKSDYSDYYDRFASTNSDIMLYSDYEVKILSKNGDTTYQRLEFN